MRQLRETSSPWFPAAVGRRSFLQQAGLSVGSMALAELLGQTLLGQNPSGAKEITTASQQPVPPLGIVDPADQRPRAKRVIWLYMAGGMSHLDTFDYKPLLTRMHGQPMPESITGGQQIAQLQGQKLNCFAPQHAFRRWGKSGQEISVIWPRLAATCADDICIVRSLWTEAINHDPAHTLMNTGSMISGRPAMGSWLWYGLGSQSHQLPGFVVMVSTGNYGQKQPIAARQWQAGFLPSRFQGVEFRSTGDPVLYLSHPPGVDDRRQYDVVQAIQGLNGIQQQSVDDPEIATRISQYELAFRMQSSVPQLMDVSDEPQQILDLYGTRGGDGTFAWDSVCWHHRLAERGVRFIQLYHRDWDHHGAVKDHIAGSAAEVDRGVAALIVDLKQRGMLDETIIVFGSEFGRTPMAQGDGRDHHIAGFTMWFAGGGFRPGMSYGATDEFGYHAQENRVSVHDVHATLLHLLGIDNARFTVKFQGLDARLTGVEPAHVVQELL